MIAFLVVFIALGRLYRDMLQRPETRALLISAGVVVIVGVAFYTIVEQWSWLDALYFCIVTLGTVGYGDITPTTQLGKIFTIIYIIVGLVIIGGFFATAGELFREHGLATKEKVTLERELRKAEGNKTKSDPTK
jgi:hypothetical protein